MNCKPSIPKEELLIHTRKGVLNNLSIWLQAANSEQKTQSGFFRGYRSKKFQFWEHPINGKEILLDGENLYVDAENSYGDADKPIKEREREFPGNDTNHEIQPIDPRQAAKQNRVQDKILLALQGCGWYTRVQRVLFRCCLLEVLDCLELLLEPNEHGFRNPIIFRSI